MSEPGRTPSSGDDPVARFHALTPEERAEKIARSPSLFDALRRYREKRHPGSTTPRGEGHA